MKKITILSLILFSSLSFSLSAQSLQFDTSAGLNVSTYTNSDLEEIRLPDGLPVLTFMVNGSMFNTLGSTAEEREHKYYFKFGDTITGELIPGPFEGKCWTARIILYNKTLDTVDIENIVPFGQTDDHIYLTSTGPWALARAKIFLPGFGPVGVILPDNAWELGYSAIPVKSGWSICALARRMSVENGERRRYRTIVYPGGKVEYTVWLDGYQGEWQNGLKKMFHEHYLFDLESFDETLFSRPDLQWIRHNYIIGLQFGWNREFYDWKEGKYNFFDFLDKGKHLFGGYDVFGLWPTWPRLGVDERNQWDLFADLPGGLDQLKFFSQEAKKKGTRFFICYNPWDESTRQENPYIGMARLIEETDADGVVLDTRGASSIELQRAADSIKPGVIMYSEGMAVTKDMPGIVSGRVHDAIYLPPPVNLNKIIKPEFAIFRVCQIHDGRIRREASVALFNGYGIELNTFAPGQFESMEEDLKYLGRTTMILRENTSNFLSINWTPLLPSLKDSIWINQWPAGEKIIYTVLSFVPEGYTGPLFTASQEQNTHFVSLWHHIETALDTINGQTFMRVRTDAFNRFDIGTRAEGNIDCIAKFPKLISASIDHGILSISAGIGDEIHIWAGMPSYQNDMMMKVKPGDHQIPLLDYFGRYEGKIVVQLFAKEELIDECVLELEPGTPRLISGKEMTATADKTPEGMVKISGGTFYFKAGNDDQFIPYPESEDKIRSKFPTFYMDKYPVTNLQFYEFINTTGYQPKDPVNYLKHWEDNKIPAGLENHPVVYVSLEDAKAYAHWAGKRLPSEIEWQYAAQGTDDRSWPWGNEFDSTCCNYASGRTTAVDAFPKGKSPFGVMDMVGNIWQLTADVYDNGTYYYEIMKGGSFYKPASSWWYVKGGPQPAYWHQLLLLVSPGFDRNSTVGFRCVKDALR